MTRKAMLSRGNTYVARSNAMPTLRIFVMMQPFHKPNDHFMINLIHDQFAAESHSTSWHSLVQISTINNHLMTNLEHLDTQLYKLHVTLSNQIKISKF